MYIHSTGGKTFSFILNTSTFQEIFSSEEMTTLTQGQGVLSLVRRARKKPMLKQGSPTVAWISL